ncbi:beta-ketoacyl synthase chain length factor [Brevundimonas sp. FT23028]|uniref:beta-ketoacyl synthase chain length factor n=1 Tax=Brevundimonas sp. FT23028 TaxID=3393748 RepID=UPI003B589773
MPVLGVSGWAAIVSDEAEERFGVADEASAIPAQQRRRLPAFTRNVLQCALPLLRDRPGTGVVLSSPNGDLESTVTLLSDIARNELLSPSLFGLSVHNAPLGALSLSLEGPGDQVSLGGDAATLSAGLLEAWTQLATGEAASVVLVHAEERLPALYGDLDEPTPGVFMALGLTLEGEGDVVQAVPGRTGALALVNALAAGQARISFSPPRLEALAA